VEIAKLNTCNKLAGTAVTKAMDSITKVEYRNIIIDQILPTVHKKLPHWNQIKIKIQQDTKPHIVPSDPKSLEAVAASG